MLHRLRKLLNGVFCGPQGNSLIFSPLPSNTDPMTSPAIVPSIYCFPCAPNVGFDCGRDACGGKRRDRQLQTGVLSLSCTPQSSVHLPARKG